MKNSLKKYIFLGALFATFDVQAITLVYNLKIRRAFSIPNLEPAEKRGAWLATAVPIVYRRDREIVDPIRGIDVTEKRKTTGSLLNVRYLSRRSWWAELTTGIENERLKSQGTSTFKTSRFGLDDIVLSGGYNFFPTDKSQFVLYGIGGIPTKRNIDPLEANDTLVGTRFFSIGAGAEISYSFIHELRRSLVLIFQTRFLHFFNRNWEPILQQGGKIQPGNVTDVFLVLQYRQRKNVFEAGYNPTIFTNQAVILPFATIDGKNFVRNSMYASYTHLFKTWPIFGRPGALGAGFSIARASRFSTKISSYWVAISMLF